VLLGSGVGMPLKQQNIKFVTFIALSIILVKDSKRGKKCSKKDIESLYLVFIVNEAF